MEIVINIDESPVKRQHITYSVKFRDMRVYLYDIEEVFYVHPDSQDMAQISRIEENAVCDFHIAEKMLSSPLIMLNHMLDTVRLFVKSRQSR